MLLQEGINNHMGKILNTRHQLPPVDVFVQQEDRSLLPASPILADDVREDLALTRGRIAAAFGECDLPPVSDDTAAAINNFFAERGWSQPQSVVIDPKKDALELRSILQSSNFGSEADREFFTGANDSVISPGGSSQIDTVIYHDWRGRYREEISELVTSWGYSIDEESLERAVEYKVAELVIHEQSHLAGKLAVEAVALEMENGEYKISDRCTSGFIDVHADIPPPALGAEGDYYTGPVLNEAWSALQASKFVLSQQGYDDRLHLGITDRYTVGAELKVPDGTKMYYGVAGIHSNAAGMVIEKLEEQNSGIIATMEEVANGITPLDEALRYIRATLPEKIYMLLNTPHYSAWRRLQEQLGLVT